MIPEFVYNEYNALVVKPHLPTSFQWSLLPSYPYLTYDFIRTSSFEHCARIARIDLSYTIMVARSSARYMLSIGDHKRYIDNLLGRGRCYPHINMALEGIGVSLSNSEYGITEQDVIRHFFGIAPIPDEKILMMM